MPSDLEEPTAVSYSEECEVRPKPFAPETLDGDVRFVKKGRNSGGSNIPSWKRTLKSLRKD